MFGLITTLLGPVTNAVSGYFERRHAMKIAIHEGRMAWEKEMAGATKTSWKDEYVLVLWTAPFAAAVLGYSGPLERFIYYWSVIPDGYAYILIALTLASFGISMGDKAGSLVGKRQAIKTVVERIKNGNGNSFPKPGEEVLDTSKG